MAGPSIFKRLASKKKEEPKEKKPNGEQDKKPAPDALPEAHDRVKVEEPDARVEEPAQEKPELVKQESEAQEEPAEADTAQTLLMDEPPEMEPEPQPVPEPTTEEPPQQEEPEPLQPDTAETLVEVTGREEELSPELTEDPATWLDELPPNILDGEEPPPDDAGFSELDSGEPLELPDEFPSHPLDVPSIAELREVLQEIKEERGALAQEVEQLQIARADLATAQQLEDLRDSLAAELGECARVDDVDPNLDALFERFGELADAHEIILLHAGVIDLICPEATWQTLISDLAHTVAADAEPTIREVDEILVDLTRPFDDVLENIGKPLRGLHKSFIEIAGQSLIIAAERTLVRRDSSAFELELAAGILTEHATTAKSVAVLFEAEQVNRQTGASSSLDLPFINAWKTLITKLGPEEKRKALEYFEERVQNWETARTGPLEVAANALADRGDLTSLRLLRELTAKAPSMDTSTNNALLVTARKRLHTGLLADVESGLDDLVYEYVQDGTLSDDEFVTRTSSLSPPARDMLRYTLETHIATPSESQSTRIKAAEALNLVGDENSQKVLENAQNVTGDLERSVADAIHAISERHPPAEE